MKQHFPVLLERFFLHAHLAVWSVLGLGWLVAVRFTDLGTRSMPFFLALLGACCLLPVSDDQTRVVAIVTFPLVAAYWLFNPDFLARLGRRELAWLFVGWIIVPWIWVWKGVPKWSVFPYDVAYILHQWFGWFDVPAEPALWPF